MQICIFEDEQHLNFEPLIYSRPVFDLVCGMTTLKEKIIRAFPKEKITLKCRNYLEPFVEEENPKCKKCGRRLRSSISIAGEWVQNVQGSLQRLAGAFIRKICSDLGRHTQISAQAVPRHRFFLAICRRNVWAKGNCIVGEERNVVVSSRLVSHSNVGYCCPRESL